MSAHEGCGDGHTGLRLRVDLTTGSTRREPVDPRDCRDYVGGGLDATRLLLLETQPGYDPLGADAPLCFMSSVVAGHEYVGLARFAVVAKSPLTGGVGECRVEGPFGHALAASGSDSIIVTGAADAPVYLLVTPSAVTIVDATDLWGTSTGEATDLLEAAHGAGAHVATIGAAGENGVLFASIETDRTFAAARMGLGAVMGSKNLKAVVILPGPAPAVHDAAALRARTDDYASRIATNDLTRSQQTAPGFGAWILGGDALQGYAQGPNYSTSLIADVGPLGAADLAGRVSVSEGGCPGCPGHCIKTFENSADTRAGGLHQEALPAFTLNLGITDPDIVLDLNAQCHLWGVDPVSLSFTLSFICEAGAAGLVDEAMLGGRVPTFGDADRLSALMTQIVEGADDVRWLASGVRRAADTLGPAASRYAMHVKGLELVSFEPRASAGQALAYAVSPLGPRYEIVEHDIDFDPVDGWTHGLDQMRTLGSHDWEPMELLDDHRVVRTALLLDMWSGLDALCISLFAGPPVRELDLPALAGLVTEVTGWRTSDSELFTWGRRRWNLMRLFNLREGLGRADDRLPDRFHDEPIDAGRHTGALVDRDQFAAALSLYYALAGWDEEGRPTPTTLTALGLSWAVAPTPDERKTVTP